VAGVWSRFAADAGGDWLHVTFDHMASEVYLRAIPPGLTPAQSVRIQRLLKRRREFVSHPLTTSYEELDPYHGAFTLATLAMGDYGIFKIINRSAIWISDPPSTLPPLPMGVHLCWTHGFSGLHEKTRIAFAAAPEKGSAGRSEPTSPKPKEKVTSLDAASLLQGVVALLTDDWRSALQHLPVLFHVRRSSSRRGDAAADEGLSLGRGGPRWRDPERTRSLPPARAVGYFFRRPTILDVLGADSWRQQEGELEDTAPMWDFYCGAMLATDLRAFHFTEPNRDDAGATGRWCGPREALPDRLSHLILLEPEPEGPDPNQSVQMRWSLFRIRHSDRCELWPIGKGAKEGYPYHKLRERTLDMVLTVLEARMR
jgi:hypothetical protein